MSLLEDVFLEDEAGEAQELERVIEGDEFDERPRSRSDSDENSAKEDEAEEDKRRVDPTSAKPKRVIKNPRFVLNPARLTGPRGIQVVTEHFKDFKFKGKGHEKDDLDLILKKLEHWAYRLYPKFQFEDCLKKIETLGKKRAVAVHLHRIRMDQISSEETVVQKDSSDDEGTPAQEPEEDEFDKLLQQQIEIARATPAPGSIKKTPFSERPSMMPKATSSPSINDEQRDRMLKNRRMAEERRLARLKQNTSEEHLIENSVSRSPTKIDDVSMERKRKSVFNSSDEDVVVSKSVTDDGYKSDTVELDDDGMVVTKSPKCYVPAKKHNRSKIYDDVDKNDNIVELDNDGKVVSRSPNKYVPAKKHNKSRIDSSDDDDNLVVNEVVTVNVDQHITGTISPKSIANKSVIDSSDDDTITKPDTIDVENHGDAKKYKRSNVIDSSESEDEAVVRNESITVDIHDSNKHVNNETDKHVTDETNEHVTTENHKHTNESSKHVTNESNKQVSNESNKLDSNKNDIYDNLRESTVENNNVKLTECSKDIENQSKSVSNSNSSCNVSNNGIFDDNKSPKINDKTKVLTESTISVSETKPSDKIEVSKVIGLEDVDELMDVDFSDDFD